MSANTALYQLFVKTRAENRAALIAYIPAGFPTQAGCHKVIETLAKAGVDAIEIGYPYSDPVMDGPTIQAAATQALENGTGVTEVFAALKHASVICQLLNPVNHPHAEQPRPCLCQTQPRLFAVVVHAVHPQKQHRPARKAIALFKQSRTQ